MIDRRLTLILLAALVAAAAIPQVLADVPTAPILSTRTENGNLILTVTATHQNPTASHYVDRIQVDADGQFTDYPQQPQTSTTFTAEINLGKADPAALSVRVHCNLHGMGQWTTLKLREPSPQYTFTILEPVGQGTTSTPPGSLTFKQGTLVEVTATPKQGWSLTNWELDGAPAGSSNPITVTMSKDRTLRAVFQQQPSQSGGVPAYPPEATLLALAAAALALPRIRLRYP